VKLPPAPTRDGRKEGKEQKRWAATQKAKAGKAADSIDSYYEKHDWHTTFMMTPLSPLYYTFSLQSTSNNEPPLIVRKQKVLL